MTAIDLYNRLGRLLDERVIDTAPHRFTPRTGIPCPYCARWLGSWVMLGIHVDGHVKAEEEIERRRIAWKISQPKLSVSNP